MLRSILTLVALVCFVGTLTASDIPYMVNVQGKLTDSGGTPLPDGDYVITFTIYDSCVDGNVVWQQTRMVEVVDALFAEILGEDDRVISGDVNLPLDVFNAAERCLGIKVGADPEMIPRQRIVALPYAYYAETADYADTAGYVEEAGHASTADYANPAAGWIDDGAVVVLQDNNDMVGIGTSNPSYDLDVDEDARIRDDLTVDDNLIVHNDLTVDSEGWVKSKFVVAPEGTAVPTYLEFYVKEDGRVGRDFSVGGSFSLEFDYDSTISISQGQTKTLDHNLGGGANDYIVFVDGKSNHASGWHQANFGTVKLALGYIGLEWRELTSSSIKLIRGSIDNQGESGDWDEVRVRIIANQ